MHKSSNGEQSYKNKILVKDTDKMVSFVTVVKLL